MPSAARIAARKLEGVCIACGTGEPAEGRAKCEECLADACAGAAERRERAAAKGLCEACMRAKRVKGRGGRCDPCADKYLARQLERARARRATA